MRHRWVTLEDGSYTKGREVCWCVNCGCIRKRYVGPGTGPDTVKYYPVGVSLEAGELPYYNYEKKVACK